MQDANDLMQHLNDVWDGVEQNIIDNATEQRRMHLHVSIQATEGHFEYSLWHRLVKNALSLDLLLN